MTYLELLIANAQRWHDYYAYQYDKYDCHDAMHEMESMEATLFVVGIANTMNDQEIRKLYKQLKTEDPPVSLTPFLLWASQYMHITHCPKINTKKVGFFKRFFRLLKRSNK